MAETTIPQSGAQLAAIAARDIQNVTDVVAAFVAIDSLLPDVDGLKWFNWLYLTVTNGVQAGLAGRQWNDPAWLAQLDVNFAKLYLGALSQWLSPARNAPRCWAVLFGSRNDVRVSRIQFALAGINAHIDHDLPQAIDTTCAQRGISVAYGSPQWNDYNQVNDILNSVVETAKQKLFVGLLGDELSSLDAVEHMAAIWSVKTAREVAWTDAEVLWDLRVLPALSQRYLDKLDLATEITSRALLVPVQ